MESNPVCMYKSISGGSGGAGEDDIHGDGNPCDNSRNTAHRTAGHHDGQQGERIMAPLLKATLMGLMEGRRLQLRDAGSAGDSAAMPESDLSMYLGLGIGVGGAILIAILIVTVKIFWKHRQHRRLIEALEVEQAVRVARAHEIGEVPRPASAARCSIAPMNVRAGWGALGSSETIEELESAIRADKKRSSISLPRRLKQKGVPLRRLKRLTAIMESPRSKATSSPAVGRQSALLEQTVIESLIPPSQPAKAYTLRGADDGDVFVSPGSPKPDVLPSFAIRSPGSYGAGIANSDSFKATGSRSVGALVATAPHRPASQVALCSQRPAMHVRSISLGAPPSRPPSGPVPPLPVIEPRTLGQTKASSRQGFCVSRSSMSSQGSTGSSVLITSPILTMHDKDRQLGSPNVADVVAEDHNASLKTVTAGQRPKPLTSNPSRLAGEVDRSRSENSIRSNIARYSVESRSSSQASADLGGGKHIRLPIPEIGLAGQVSISRVSSSQSITSTSGVQKIITPRKPSRISVSATGSPAERRKASILRDISANSLPVRQPSNATQDSGRSSNGNPFQWDQPLPKPSAMKGSPNARKGHRRQNCVRISTLTPQILGPPPSRPTSPSIMHGIEEEASDEQEGTADPNKLRFVSNQCLSRPPSSASFAPNLRVQTLRASLTPSSPTLSAWNAYQEYGLPSNPSDSQLSNSLSTATRTASRQSQSHSDRSSIFTIPSFPSPMKATVAPVQLSQPVPQFCLSRPSTDIDEEENSSSPFGLQISSDRDMPSSPPLPSVVAKVEAAGDEYDPAHPLWTNLNIPPQGHGEYDPASPMRWDATEPERSSGLFPSAAQSLQAGTAEDKNTPNSLPSPYGGDTPDTPPCSPKTMPEGFQAFFENKTSGSKPPRTSEEKLTSENASRIMAGLPPVTSHDIIFSGAPVFLPPEEPEGYASTTPERAPAGRSHAVSDAAPQQTYHPLHPAPPPPMPTILSSDIDPAGSPTTTITPDPTKFSGDRTAAVDILIPSPLHLHPHKPTASPSGPRIQPPNSVLKTTQALRRMNSEANQPTYIPSPSASVSDFSDMVSDNRESGRYVLMGREASPLLPWIGSPDPSESCADFGGVFDFGFTAGGAEEDGNDGWPSALDEIDLAEAERKLDGALAGFVPMGMPSLPEESGEAADARKQGEVLWGDELGQRSSVWNDGEKFWDLPEKENIVPEGGVLPGLTLIGNDGTPRKSSAGGDWEMDGLGMRKSIQMTPRSLYDSDGFLRT